MASSNHRWTDRITVLGITSLMLLGIVSRSVNAQTQPLIEDPVSPTVVFRSSDDGVVETYRVETTEPTAPSRVVYSIPTTVQSAPVTTYYGSSTWQPAPVTTVVPPTAVTTYMPAPASVPVTTYQPITTYRPVTQYQPTTTYRPVTSYQPMTTYQPTTAYRPVTVYRPTVDAPPVAVPVNAIPVGPEVIVRPKVYVRGQPLRNMFRAITP